MSGPGRRARLAVAAVRSFGLPWLLYRARYAAELRSGLMQRRYPAFRWDEAPLAAWLADPALADPAAYHAHRVNAAPAFFFAPADRAAYAPRFAPWDTEAAGPLAEVDALAAGQWRYFGHHWAELGFPPAWNTNPFTGQRAPATQHWSRIGDFDVGDIKVVWEPSRFGPAFALVRSYWRTGDERCPELFWRLVESWREANPPLAGPNWKCGQETSIRVMAWCFGLYGFLGSRASTPLRVAALAQAIAVSGRRIEQNLDYALSQRNNHGMSEGMGLFTIGALFPEFRDAERWRDTGRRVLESLGRELIYPDGSFVQHSLNYHRLMLHVYVWAMRLGAVAGAPFSDVLRSRVAASANLLAQLQDVQSGRVPLYGANDGALVLPLSNTAYHDFRPVVQAARLLTEGVRSFEPGPWDEDLLWLFGRDALGRPVAQPPRTDLEAAEGGYYTLRAPTGFAFTRCACFRHRPGHADQLHVDLWRNGENVALDAGTFSYNAPPPWDEGLERTVYHNTVSVDGLDQMGRVSRFLWYPWAAGSVHSVRTPARGDVAGWEGEHDGYLRLRPPARHRRALLRLGDDAWLVVDALSCDAERNYRLHWLMPDLACEWDAVEGSLVLHAVAGPYFVRVSALGGAAAATLVRADPSSPRGWRAPFYGAREPALSLALAQRARRTCFWTVFSTEPCRVTRVGGVLAIEAASWRATADVNTVRAGALVEVTFQQLGADASAADLGRSAPTWSAG